MVELQEESRVDVGLNDDAEHGHIGGRVLEQRLAGLRVEGMGPANQPMPPPFGTIIVKSSKSCHDRGDREIPTHALLLDLRRKPSPGESTSFVTCASRK